MKKIIKWFNSNNNNKHLAAYAVVLGFALFAVLALAQPFLANSEVVRLHILAHNDTKSEQEAKLILRDYLWPFVDNMLKNANTADEAKKIISTNIEEIQKEANKILYKQNINHTVQVKLADKIHFPTMSYAGIIFPQGNYTALQIIIGDGIGQNWWCVMFPSMCLLDIVRAENLDESPQTQVAQTTNSVTIRPRSWLAERLKALFQ